MDNQLLHTPDGVRDLYGAECEIKLLIQERIHQVFHNYGYADIETPAYEFFDIFNKERGSIGSRKMFKFFDRENNTMVLRPDFTPGIARCAAKYYSKVDGPVRLCYNGLTFINNSSYQGRLGQTTQAGCELIGNDSFAADAEMIAILIDAILSSGLKEFQIEIGHVGFYEGLVKEAGLSDEARNDLRTILRNKNLFLIDDLLKENNVSEELRNAIYALPQTFGGVEILDQAAKMTSNEEALLAIEHLKTVYDILKAYDVAQYVTFDLGVMSELNYYTGVVFRAYTYEIGEPIASGGRYDRLIGQFGSDKASIGTAINVDLLCQAIARQEVLVPIESKGKLIVNKNNLVNAIQLANYFRKSGIPATLVSKDELDAMNTERYDEIIMADSAAMERYGL